MLVTDPSAFGSYGFAPPQAQPGNWLTAGLASGWHQGLGMLGGAGQAATQLLGMPEASAQWGRVAAAQAEQAQAASRPDIEQGPWYHPSAIGYRLAQMVPSLGLGVAGAIAGGAFAPEEAVGAGALAVGAAARAVVPRMVGAGAAMYPQIAGGNVEAAKQANQGELSPENARKALALGVPEAAAAGFVPGRLAGMFEHGVVGNLGARFLKGSLAMGGYNAAQMGVQEAVTQQAFTPDMPLTDRARGIVDAAMTGALGGGVFGGLTAALRPRTAPLGGKPSAEISTDDLNKVTAPLALPPPRVYSGPGGASFSLDAAAQAAHEQAQQPLSGPILSRALAPIPGEGVVDQGGAPLYGRPGGQSIGPSLGALDQDALARAAVGATTPPSDQLALPSPDAVSKLSDSELQAQVSALAEKAKRPGRGGFDKGGLGSAQAGLYTMFQQEVARRTPPGATPGPGFLTFTPAEAQQRAGQIADFKTQVTADLPKQALQHGFFQNFNSADEPDLINALRRQKDVFDDTADGRSPKWFKQLASSYGVMDTSGNDVDPAVRVEATGQKLIETAKAVQTERDPVARQKLVDQFKTKDLPAYRDAKDVVAWHDEADARLEAIRKGPPLPPKPTGQELLAHPVIAERLANLKIDATGRVPDAAGIDAKDPSLVHIDSRVNGGKPTAMIDGIETPVQQFWAVHEIAEAYGAVDLGENYDVSHHQMGIVAERQIVRDFAIKNGKDPTAFEKAYNGWSDSQIKIAKKPNQTPLADVAKYPYVHDRTRAGKEEMSDAVQEPGAAGLDVQQPPANGEALGGAHLEGNAASGTREVQEGDAPFSYLDKFFGEKADQAHAPEGLVPNLQTENGGRVLRDLTPEQEAPLAAQSARMQQMEQRARLQAMHDAEPEGSARQQFMAKQLASREPAAVRNALRTLTIQDEVENNIRAPRSIQADREIGAPIVHPQLDAPDWLRSHLENTGGTTVYEDGENALIRGYDASGDPVYLPVNRMLDRRSMDDISTSKAPWLLPSVRTTLQAAARQDRALNDALAKRRPDGPFVGKEGQTIGTPSADPRIVSYIDGLMKQVGLGNMRVLVAHPADVAGEVADKIGLNGDYMPARTSGMDGLENGHVRFFGTQAQDAYIYIRPSMRDAQTIEVAAHEVGHIIDEVALRTAPPETRAAVDQAYDNWFRKVQGGMSLEQLHMSKRALTSAMAAKRAIETGESAQTLAEMSPADQQYLTSKKEWFADQVARWATTSDKPRTIVDKFFEAVGRKLRVLMSIVTGHQFMPSEAVAEFLNHMGPGSDQQWRSMDPRQRLNVTMQDRQPTRDPAQMEALVQGYVADAGNVTGKVVRGFLDGAVNFKGAMRKLGASLASTNGIRDGYIATKIVSGIRDHYFVVQDQRLNEEAKNKVNILSQQAMAALPEEMRGRVQQFMLDLQQARARGINPFKSWADHPELHKADNSADLAGLHRGLRSDLDRIRQGGGFNALDAMLTNAQTNEWQELAAHMWKAAEIQASKGVELAFPAEVPGTTFRNNYTLHNDMKAANAYWSKMVTDLHAAIKAKIAEVDATASTLTDKKAQRAVRATIGDLRATSRMVQQGIVQAADKTYAPVQHGGGDYFVSAKLATDVDGKVKPEAVAAMRKMAEAGDWHFGMYSMGDDQAKFFTRLETQAKQDRFYQAMVELKAAGHLDPGEAIKTGNRMRLNQSPDVAPYELQQMLQRFKEEVPEGVDPKTRAAIIQGLTDQWLDMLPDHSLQHFLQRRDLVHGYDPNMASNMAIYQRASARRSSMMEMSGRVSVARGLIIRQVEDAKSNPDLDVNHKNAAQDLAQEVLRREAEQAWHISNPTVDLLQAGMHSIVIGFNPAYFFTVMSQIPTLGWGELAKVQGFAGSAKYIAGSTSRAFNIMRAVATSPDWANVGFREDALRTAGISERDIGTIMRLDAAGGLTSTFTRAVTDLGDEGHAGAEKFRQYANFMGTFSETLPRVMMALAAGDAHDANPGKVTHAGFAGRDDYVKSVTNQSQMEWGPEMASRFTGKAGMLGSYGKLAFAFTRFHTMQIEKLYREFMTALPWTDHSPQARAEAHTFLAAHLVAVTMLAGTLGLPMAAAFAGAADKILHILTGQDNVDVQGLYRTWLARTFGPDIGDVLAKGLPRGFGIDFSHLGDQNILPGTSLLTDKRKLEDSMRDFFQTAAGPAAHEASSIFLGTRDMLNGDYLLGLTRMLPEGFKGVAESLYAGTHGFVDKYGLPTTGGPPTAADLAKMAVGLDPTTLARYNEDKRTMQGIEAQREYHEQNIEQHLVRSMTQHDPDATQYWIEQARDYTMQNPLMGGPLFNMGQTMREHMLQAAQARALGVPIGVKPLDVRMREATSFLNPQ